MEANYCYDGLTGRAYKFTGKERDSESGLDYFGARYYASSMGRFESADAFRQKLLLNPQDLNLYTYSINNPLRYRDPNGRDWKDVAKGVFHGANNFVEHSYSAIVAAAKDPFTVLHGAATSIEVAAKAYGTAEGRGNLVGQWKSLDQQGKTAVVTEALLTGATAGALKARAYAESAPSGPPELPAFNGKTQGVLVTNEGASVALESGGKSNYVSATHVEGKAALYIRDAESTGGIVYHNNPGGTCGYCNAQIPTLLPEGAQLEVVPPENAVPSNSQAVAEPKTYTGNANEPRRSE